MSRDQTKRALVIDDQSLDPTCDLFLYLHTVALETRKRFIKQKFPAVEDPEENMGPRARLL